MSVQTGKGQCAMGTVGTLPVCGSPDANQEPPYQLSFQRAAVRTAVSLLSHTFIFIVSEHTMAGKWTILFSLYNEEMEA